MDAQLAEMRGYSQRAADAVEKGNNVLSDARSTLATLQGALLRPTMLICPTNSALLINFLLSSDAEILLISTD